MVMREQSVGVMEENEEFFRPFLDEEEEGSWGDYLQLMRKSGEWGGHL